MRCQMYDINGYYHWQKVASSMRFNCSCSFFITNRVIEHYVFIVIDYYSFCRNGIADLDLTIASEQTSDKSCRPRCLNRFLWFVTFVAGSSVRSRLASTNPSASKSGMYKMINFQGRCGDHLQKNRKFFLILL